MKTPVFLEGFSKLSKEEKIRTIAEVLSDPSFTEEAASFQHIDNQSLFDSFSENTLTNYYLPFGIAPNFIINQKIYHIPMVVEESSVVAAASSSAKFWSTRGGFRAKVVSSLKKGHVHFLWTADKVILLENFEAIKQQILAGTSPITANMQKRGGGIVSIALEDYTKKMANYYRLSFDFNTVDSMGANFINTTLESAALTLRSYVDQKIPEKSDCLEVIMSILSNYTPECIAECQVSCPVEQLDKVDGVTQAATFVHKFQKAVEIATIDPYRATTHNKGIMNGIDAVVLATGNDFRAVEAGAHAFASSDGTYRSLSSVEIKEGIFTFSLQIPLSIGTVGGLTALHPLAKRAMQILGNPTANELMMIIAAAGLANNFAAIKALVTKGIQQGHMKMHLPNILSQFNLTASQKAQATEYFKGNAVSHSAVRNFLKNELNIET